MKPLIECVVCPYAGPGLRLVTANGETQTVCEKCARKMMVYAAEKGETKALASILKALSEAYPTEVPFD